MSNSLSRFGQFSANDLLSSPSIIPNIQLLVFLWYPIAHGGIIHSLFSSNWTISNFLSSNPLILSAIHSTVLQMSFIAL